MRLHNRGGDMDYGLIAKIEDIADLSSKESGTSYEDYILLFSERVDKAFKKHYKRNTAVYLASQYGYVSKKNREEVGSLS